MIFKNVKNRAEQLLDSYKSNSPATYSAAQQAIGGLLILDGFVGIDNPFGGKKRSGILGSFIGVLIGVAVLFFGVLFFNLFGVQKLTADTDGKIASIGKPQTDINRDRDSNRSTSTTCGMKVRYTVDGKEYTRSTKSTSSGNCKAVVGTSVAIKYDPANPSDFDTAGSVNTLNTIKKFTPFIGLLILLVSGFTFSIRLLSIIYGWKILKSGRTLAKTLPAGTDLSTIKKEIRQNFAKSIFGMGGNSQPTAAPIAAPVTPDQQQTPVEMSTQQYQTQPPTQQYPTQPPTQQYPTQPPTQIDK